VFVTVPAKRATNVSSSRKQLTTLSKCSQVQMTFCLLILSWQAYLLLFVLLDKYAVTDSHWLLVLQCMSIGH